MLKYDSLVKIAKFFIGDNTTNFYSRKTGSSLVRFFNSNFNYQDNYAWGVYFPPRWQYTADKLVELQETSKLADFFSIILKKRICYEWFNLFWKKCVK